MMQIVNDAGQVLELRGGKWVPVEGAPASSAPAGAAAAPRERLTSGAVNAAMVGAGDALTTMGRNARDLFAGLRGDAQGQLDIANEREEAAGLRQRLREEAPIAAAVGGMLPSLATLPIGMGVGGAGMLAGAAGRLASNVGMGAGMGGLASESGNMGEDAAVGGALGGVGSLAGNMIARVQAGRQGMQAARAAANAPAAGLDSATAEVIEGAKRAGMAVTPGQQLGDAGMRQVEASLSSNPLFSTHWQAIKQGNQRMLNSHAARAMGVQADNVGPEVRAQAAQQLSREFEQVGEAIGQVPTAPIVGKLEKLANADSMGLVPRMEAARLRDKIAAGVANRSGKGGEAMDFVSGQSLMKERSSIARSMRDAFAANRSDKGEAYGELLEIIDEAARNAATRQGGDVSAGLAMAQRYDSAREAWSVLRAMDRGGATIDGQVLPGQAARLMKGSDKTGFWGRAAEDGSTTQRIGGQGDPLGTFYDALRFSSSQMGRDIVGDSGTATRLSMNELFNGGALVGVGRLGLRAGQSMMTAPAVRRYMAASPESLAAMNAAATSSAATGWAKGQARGGAAGRAAQAGQGLPGILSDGE